MNAQLPAGFIQFLMAAKRTTYAAEGGSASIPPLLQDSKQLEFADGEFLYRDIYVGVLHFVGQEVVYFGKRAVWSMSYSGGLLPGVAKSDVKPVYSFLRRALREVPEHLPLRGPWRFEADPMRYVFQCNKALERFVGVEEIYRGDDILYRVHVSGGSIA